MVVHAYQTYQTSRTTFSAAISAVPVMLLARDTTMSLGQVSTKYPSRCRPKKNQIIPTIRYRPSVKCRPFTGCRTLLSAALTHPKPIGLISRKILNMTSIIIGWCLVGTYSVLCAAPIPGAAPLPPPLGQGRTRNFRTSTQLTTVMIHSTERRHWQVPSVRACQ